MVFSSRSGKSKPYNVEVQRGGKKASLGHFATAEEAALCFARSPEGQRGVAESKAAEAAAAAAAPTFGAGVMHVPSAARARSKRPRVAESEEQQIIRREEIEGDFYVDEAEVAARNAQAAQHRAANPALYALLEAREKKKKEEEQPQLAALPLIVDDNSPTGFWRVRKRTPKKLNHHKKRSQTAIDNSKLVANQFPFVIATALKADVSWPTHVSFATAEAAATYVMLAYRARVAGDTPPPKTAEGWASAIEAARASKASGAPVLPSASSLSSSASSSSAQ